MRRSISNTFPLSAGLCLLALVCALLPYAAVAARPPAPLSAPLPASLSAPLPASSPVPSSADEQAILQADHSLEQALEKGDKVAADKLLDPDFTWTDWAGTTQTRIQLLQNVDATKGAKFAVASTQAGSKVYVYGQVGVVQANNGLMHALRVWVKRPAGWRDIVYHEVRSLPNAPTVTPGAGKDCNNPCKSIPFQPKNEAEKGVAAAYSALETAAETHNAAAWAGLVADEFVVASSNSNVILDKKQRIAGLQRETMAGVSPTAFVSGRMYAFGDAVVMVSQHQPEHGKPLRVTRVWVKRDGKWMETLSYQTSIQSA